MSGKVFSVKDICDILDKCRETGVTQLQIGNLTASFLPPEPKAPEVATPTKEQIEASKLLNHEVFLNNERRIRLEQLDNLRLSDPEAFEDLQTRGELEHARENSDGVGAG